MNAQVQLAYWLQSQHPKLFAYLLSKAQPQKPSANLSALYRSSFCGRGLGSFGDYADYVSIADSSDALSDLSDYSTSVDASPFADSTNSALDDTALDSPVTSDQVSALTGSADEPNLQNEINVNNLSATQTPPVVNADSAPTISTPSTVSSAVSSVGHYLSSPAGVQTLLAAAKGANTIISSNAAAATITTQAQRAAAGLAPANVSYTSAQNADGTVSVVPVLNTSSGAYQLTAAGLDAITPTFLDTNAIYIIGGILALLFFARE